MNEQYVVLLHDLMIMKEMAHHMAEYLDSDVEMWSLSRTNMPRLTVGGYLMREHRLTALRARLQPQEQADLEASVERFQEALAERVVRLEKRAHSELHSRIGEWTVYLRHIANYTDEEVNRYASMVDTRVVIDRLIDKLQTPPYRLEPRVIPEIRALDANLNQRLAKREFVWDEVWQPAYPKYRFWWLYGCPQPIMVSA
jgi:hypothetical protein